MTTTRTDQTMKTQTASLPAVSLRKFPIAMLIAARVGWDEPANPTAFRRMLQRVF